MEPMPEKKTTTSEPISLLDDDEAIECGICFESVNIRGVIDCCPHIFCYECISQWSTLQNTCPVCQRRFEFVTRVFLSNSPLSMLPSPLFLTHSHQMDSSESKPAGRKRKRSTAFVPHKNQRIEDDWNPTREELLHIAQSSTPTRRSRRSPHESSARSVQLMNAHLAAHLARSSPAPVRSRYCLRDYPAHRFPPNPYRERSSSMSFRSHSNPNSQGFHHFNPLPPPMGTGGGNPPHRTHQQTPSRPRTRATPTSHRGETVVIDLTSDEETI